MTELSSRGTYTGPADKPTCSSCGNPLGNTVKKCHECGGPTYRVGETYQDTSLYELLRVFGI